MNHLPGGYDPIAALRAEMQRAHADFQRQINGQAGAFRSEIDSHRKGLSQGLNDLAALAKSITGTRSGGDYDIRSWWPKHQNVTVEDLPGRRVPYVLMIDIPILNNSTSLVEGSVTISQEGPFVAVRRMATFQSFLQARITDPRTSAISDFTGRSYGRYRPIHSAYDLNDGLSSLLSPPNAGGVLGQPNLPGLLSLPASGSGFRTMEFDGRIAVFNAGSSFPRQNLDIGIPSSMWTSQINSPQDLGCLDFFERGEVITVKITPSHVNNPPAGNVTGNNLYFGGVAGLNSWPFLAGQYDPHEGIYTPDAFVASASPVTHLGTDPLTRIQDGILTVAWEGYRIQQPVGPGR